MNPFESIVESVLGRDGAFLGLFWRVALPLGRLASLELPPLEIHLLDPRKLISLSFLIKFYVI